MSSDWAVNEQWMSSDWAVNEQWLSNASYETKEKSISNKIYLNQFFLSDQFEKS